MKGGARPGAGRKKGVPNKNPRKKVEAKAIIGPMPADIMLDLARYHFARSLELRKVSGPNRDESEIRIENSLTLAAADKVASYYHPKLATLQSNVNLTGRLTLAELVEASLPTPANSNAKLIEAKESDAV